MKGFSSPSTTTSCLLSSWKKAVNPITADTMLHADKDNLRYRTAVRLIRIREKELHLYARNARKLALVTAVLAGIAYFGLIYCSKMPYFIDSHPVVKGIYGFGLIISLCLSLYNCMGATMVMMLAPGHALRGSQGAIHVAVEGALVELESVVETMHLSVYSFLATAVAYSWLTASPNWIASVVLTGVVVASAAVIRLRVHMVRQTFPLHDLNLTSGAFIGEKDFGADAQTAAGAGVTSSPDARDTRHSQPAPSLPRQRSQPAPGRGASSHELF